MKVSCTHFQCAAWSFHAVPDRHPRQATQDLSPDLLAFLSQVCLAQAQECILEKSILDHRKPTIVAKVCAQVAEYYRAAHVHINYSNSVSSDSGQENIADCVGDKRCRFWSRS